MKITLTRKNDNVLFEAANEQGNTFNIDGAEQIGGVNGGFRPMQLLLAGLAGCSSMDIVSILKKQRQDLKQFQVEVEAERKKEKYTSPFSKIHMTFKLSGSLDEKKIQRAIELGVEKYCSAAEMLGKMANITWSYEIIES